MRPPPLRLGYTRYPLSDLALLIVRLVLGFIFLAHGSQKLFGFFGGSGLSGFTQMVAHLGLPLPNLLALLGALSEFLGGLFVLLGFATGVGSGLIIFSMLVAIWKVTGPKGFFIQNNGYEYNLLIIAICVSLILTGPGRWAVWRFGPHH